MWVEKMDAEFQFKNCSSSPSVPSLRRANLITVIFSATTLLLLLLFLALLVLYRAYKTALQRLFLYLTIATALDALTTSLNIELQFDVTPKLCGWIGFCDVWMSNLIELFNFAFTVYLITIAWQKFKGRELQCLGRCRAHPVLTEVITTVVIILFPLSYLWVPAMHHTYGLSQTQCWLRKLDKNCNNVSHSDVDATLLELTDLSLHLTVIISFTVLIIFISMLVIKLRHSRKESFETIGRAIFLVVLIGTSTCTRIGQFVVNIGVNFKYFKVNDYLYDAIDNPAYSISNLLVPLAFGVYLYSPRKLGIKSLWKQVKIWASCRCCHRRSSKTKKTRTKSDPKDPGIIDDDGLESVESSIGRDLPSHTTGYSSPYTNEFTNITEIVSSQECHNTPKYGSIQT